MLPLPPLAYVECTYAVENDLTRFLDTGPIANRFVVDSADGAITSVNDVPNEQLDEVWQTFADWVDRNHPDDVERVFITGSTSRSSMPPRSSCGSSTSTSSSKTPLQDIASTDSTLQEET